MQLKATQPEPSLPVLTTEHALAHMDEALNGLNESINLLEEKILPAQIAACPNGEIENNKPTPTQQMNAITRSIEDKRFRVEYLTGCVQKMSSRLAL